MFSWQPMLAICNILIMFVDKQNIDYLLYLKFISS